jgi:hypothetical protein
VKYLSALILALSFNAHAAMPEAYKTLSKCMYVGNGIGKSVEEVTPFNIERERYSESVGWLEGSSYDSDVMTWTRENQSEARKFYSTICEAWVVELARKHNFPL